MHARARKNERPKNVLKLHTVLGGEIFVLTQTAHTYITFFDHNDERESVVAINYAVGALGAISRGIGEKKSREEERREKSAQLLTLLLNPYFH